MANLKFKNFTWPHNPSTFNISYDRKQIIHEYPDVNGAEIEDLGMRPRTLSGTGVFYGPNAYDNFAVLSKMFYYDKTPGQLSHPKYGEFTVQFTKYTAREEPLPDYVEYDFEFIEHKPINIISQISNNSSGSSSSGSSSSGSGTSSNSTRYYTVVSGDSLTKISKKYYGTGNDWKKIADANKSLIKNPNIIYPGWKLVIPY